MHFHYQALVNYPCSLTSYPDVALVAIGAQDAAPLDIPAGLQPLGQSHRRLWHKLHEPSRAIINAEEWQTCWLV